jgi:hypothetical protein
MKTKILQNTIATSPLEGVYQFHVNKDRLVSIQSYDNEWNSEFLSHVSASYPYTMSPETSKIVSEIAQEISGYLRTQTDEHQTWSVNSDRGNYYDKLLNRVSIPDTIDPIVYNIDSIVDYLAKINSRGFLIRSFFAGAGIAEKSLLARIHQAHISDTTLITTDFSLAAVSYAIANFQVWNQQLPASEQYNVFCVMGCKIPSELFERSNTVIFQIADARLAATQERLSYPNIKYDVLLLDNGLPYVPTETAEVIFENALHHIGKDGLFIATLGLDEKIYVDINLLYQIGQILMSLFGVNLNELYAKKCKLSTPYNYHHFYDFRILDDDQIVIDKVVSGGAAKIYSWIGSLIRRGQFRLAAKVVNTIKQATKLSTAKDNILTTPWKSHLQLESIINKFNLPYQILVDPLTPEVYGWYYDKEYSVFRNSEGQVIDKARANNYFRLIDPVVLRMTQIWVSPEPRS